MKKAVLIIHGFVGALSDNEYLMNYLTYEKDFDVFAKTLPGHFHDINYQRVVYTDWVDYVSKEVEDLISHGYKTIYVIGHSMGGILAGNLAIKYKEVKKVIFLNASYTYLNLKQNKIDILENKDYKDYVEVFERVLHTSIPFFLEFVKLVKEYHASPKEINKTALVLQSTEDQIVPIENGIEIYNNLQGEKYLTFLEGERHSVFEGGTTNETRKNDIASYIVAFLKGGNKWRKIWKEKI